MEDGRGKRAEKRGQESGGGERAESGGKGAGRPSGKASGTRRCKRKNSHRRRKMYKLITQETIVKYYGDVKILNANKQSTAEATCRCCNILHLPSFVHN